MADNLAVTAGSGTVVATDQVGTAHYQRVKITDGTADSENHLLVEAAGNVTAKLIAGTASIGKLAANSGVDIGDVDILSIAAGDNNIGNVDVASSALPTGAATAAKQPALGTAGTASSDVITVQGIASMTPMIVDLGANNDVTVTSGAITETNSGAIKTAVEVIDNAISGSEMQVDVVAALPAGTNAIGKLAANSGVDIGDVDVTSLPALAAGTNTIGKVAPNEYELAGNTTHVKKYYTSAGAATDGVVWSPAAGKRWYVTDLIINVSAAATVTLEDDLTAGDSAVFKAELAANSGISHSFNTPLYSGEDAADLLITTSAGNVYVCVTGYEI